MMKKLKSVLIVGLTMLTFGLAIAQTAQNVEKHENKVKKEKTPEQRAQKVTDKMTKKLSLSEDQAREVYLMQLDFAKTEKAEREARKAKKMAQSEKMRAILNEDQAKTFDEMKNKRRKGKKGKKRCHKEKGAEK